MRENGKQMDDEWVPVMDDLPQIGRGYKNVSMDVLCKCSNGEIIEGYYDYRSRRWYNEFSRLIKADVVAWKSVRSGVGP